MAISFKCPNCENLCAFNEKHAGKHAKCLKCGQSFIVPAKTVEKAEKLKPAKTYPIKGFYKAVFLHSWRLFIKLEGITGLVLVIAVITCKFFVGHTD